MQPAFRVAAAAVSRIAMSALIPALSFSMRESITGYADPLGELGHSDFGVGKNTVPKNFAGVWWIVHSRHLFKDSTSRYPRSLLRLRVSRLRLN